MKSGVYKIRIPGVGSKDVDTDNRIEVECDDNGWTTILRRGQYGNPPDYFYRNFEEYREGFGDLTKEHWIGLENLMPVFWLQTKR